MKSYTVTITTYSMLDGLKMFTRIIKAETRLEAEYKATWEFKDGICKAKVN